MQIVGSNLHEMSNPVYFDKKEKYLGLYCLPKLLPSMLSINNTLFTLLIYNIICRLFLFSQRILGHHCTEQYIEQVKEQYPKD